MENKINFNNEEMNVVVHKSIEIYETIKDCIMKIDNTKLEQDDKKHLALLLGISTTENQVGKALKLLKWKYGISVFPNSKSEDECDRVFKNEFAKIFDQNNIMNNSSVADLMLVLLQNKTVKNLHHQLGLPVTCIKLILYHIKETDEKGLQKEKTMIL